MQMDYTNYVIKRTDYCSPARLFLYITTLGNKYKGSQPVFLQLSVATKHTE